MSAKGRLIADRFRRIWAVVQTIADEPGHSRGELADRFFVSERQIQADLDIIRHDMHLPLVRRQGYRFASEGPNSGPGCPDLRDAQLLVLALSQARVGRQEQMRRLLDKVPAMFPPHLQPLVERTLEAVTAPRSATQGQVFAALGDALLTGAWVRLYYPPHHTTATPFNLTNPIVKPELLLPYMSHWYLLGDVRHGAEGQKTSTRMLPLDEVTAVTTIKLPQLLAAGSGR